MVTHFKILIAPLGLTSGNLQVMFQPLKEVNAPLYYLNGL
jgi:hypothetical protein